jgi:hypothetical protein
VEFATPLSHDEERIDASYDGEPLRYRTMEDILDDQPVPRLVPHDLDDGNKSLYLIFVGVVFFSASWTAFRAVRTVS